MKSVNPNENRSIGLDNSIGKSVMPGGGSKNEDAACNNEQKDGKSQRIEGTKGASPAGGGSQTRDERKIRDCGKSDRDEQGYHGRQIKEGVGYAADSANRSAYRRRAGLAQVVRSAQLVNDAEHLTRKV